MDWLLGLLLTLVVDGKAPAVERVLARASSRAVGLETLKGKRVLMFGDSMVNSGINIWLEAWFKKHGVTRYVARSWASSTTVKWAKVKKLGSYIWRTDPDIVFIVLGTNELFHAYPKMKIRPMRQILKRVGKRRQVFWIGPPTWAKDKGLIKVMKQTMPPGHFFDSGKLKLGRKKDGYHPNMAGAKKWARAIWDWYTAKLVPKKKQKARRPRPKRRARPRPGKP